MKQTSYLVVLLIIGITSNTSMHATSSPSTNDTQVPRYQIYLDSPTQQMWTEVISDYKQKLQIVAHKMTDILSNQLGGHHLLSGLISLIMKTINPLVYYGSELKAIAKQSGIDLGLLTIMQLIYEASAACTSIICPDKNGNPIHIRTMDWEMDFLQPLTLEIEFIRNNQTVCIATSWAGYVGVLTGMRLGSDGFSVSVNFRKSNDGSTYWNNIKKAVSGAWPIGFLVREVLTQAEHTCFMTAHRILQNSKLIAPVYFMLSGYNQNEGVLLTRNRASNVKPLYLHPVLHRSFIIQTNIDHWSNNQSHDVLHSVQRRRVALREMNRIKNDIAYSNLWLLVNEYPIFAEYTVYGTLMSVHNGYYETRIPSWHGFTKKPDWPWKKCVKCKQQFQESLNIRGECAHIGEWNSNYSRWRTLGQMLGLVKNTGYWSCCSSNQFNSTCSKSQKHA